MKYIVSGKLIFVLLLVIGLLSCKKDDTNEPNEQESTVRIGEASYSFSDGWSGIVIPAKATVKNGRFVVYSENQDRSCTITFGVDKEPNTISQFNLTQSDNPQPDEANIRFNVLNESSLYLSLDGTLDVTVADDVLQVSFNNVPARKVSTGEEVIVSGSFIFD